MSNLHFLLSTKWIIESKTKNPFDIFPENIKYLTFNLDGTYKINDHFFIETVPIEEYGGELAWQNNLNKWFWFDNKFYLQLGFTKGYCIITPNKEDRELNIRYISPNKECISFKATEAMNYLFPENYSNSLETFLTLKVFALLFMKDFCANYFLFFSKSKRAFLLKREDFVELLHNDFLHHEDEYIYEEHFPVHVLPMLYSLDNDKIILFDKKDYSVIGNIEIGDDLKMVGDFLINNQQLSEWNICQVSPLSIEDMRSMMNV